MKNETIVKERSVKSFKGIFLPIIFALLSLGAGFAIAFWGKGQSYIENNLITALITLFGFGITSTIFLYQAFKKEEMEKTKKLIHAIVNNLILTLALIGFAILFDFLASLDFAETANIVLKSLKYGAMIYASICQVDILIAFIKIVKGYREKK